MELSSYQIAFFLGLLASRKSQSYGHEYFRRVGSTVRYKCTLHDLT